MRSRTRNVVKIDGLQNVDAIAFQRIHRRLRTSKRAVDSQSFSVGNEDRIQEIGSKVRDIRDRCCAQILRLILNTDHAGIDQRQSFAANLNPWSIFGRVAVAMKYLYFAAAGGSPNA